MAREKSMFSKLLDGRCQGTGTSYSAWVHANEVSSAGSAFIIPDPIAQRAVHLLSNAERIVFWQLRYNPEVIEIREQMVLLPKFVNEICDKNKFRHPKKILTTDFLVEYADHSFEAISVKPNNDIYVESKSVTQRTLRKVRRRCELREMQRQYWQDYYRIPFSEIYSDELDYYYSNNIERCMAFYDQTEVRNEEQLFCHLVARRLINVDLTGKYVYFKQLLNMYREEMKYLIEMEGSNYA